MNRTPIRHVDPRGLVLRPECFRLDDGRRFKRRHDRLSDALLYVCALVALLLFAACLLLFATFATVLWHLFGD